MNLLSSGFVQVCNWLFVFSSCTIRRTHPKSIEMKVLN